MIKAPRFWTQPLPIYARWLCGLSWIYVAVIRLRFYFSNPVRVSVPVLCVGNITVGGAGKTPTCLALAEFFLIQGRAVGLLTRGYGGRLKGPLHVTPEHTATEVGDEALLLSEVAPTWVSKNRSEGALSMVKAGIDLIIMDDGHQHHTLKKDCALVVIDGVEGFGNKEIFPWGPLRETLSWGLSRSDAVLIVRPPSFQLTKDLSGYQKPVFSATIALDISTITSDKIIAFCGLGYPYKFFNALKEAGITPLKERAFPDHYFYTKKDLDALQKEASAEKAQLVTTKKDWMRLSPEDQKNILPLEMSLKCGDWPSVETFLKKKLHIK